MADAIGVVDLRVPAQSAGFADGSDQRMSFSDDSVSRRIVNNYGTARQRSRAIQFRQNTRERSSFSANRARFGLAWADQSLSGERPESALNPHSQAASPSAWLLREVAIRTGLAIDRR